MQSIARQDPARTDRKLLVSISRAEEQIIVLGSHDSLEHAVGYRDLIDTCKRHEGFFDRSFTEIVLNG
jgi:superfamily I DNA and/or RNA helicase